MDVIVISFEKEVLRQVSDLLAKVPEIKRVFAFDKLPDAEKYLELQEADLVLLDADDDETGWIIPYKKIRTFHQDLNIVLISRSRDAAVKAYETGVKDYLLKPVKESQLKRVIEKFR